MPGLNLNALAAALGHGALAGAQGYEKDEEGRRRDEALRYERQRQASAAARQAQLDQAHMTLEGAQTDAARSLATQRATPRPLPPRRWVPSTEQEALDFETKRSRAGAKARAEFRAPARGTSAGQVTPKQRQSFFQQRLVYHMNPRADSYGDPVAGTGLDREEAESEARADVEAAYGAEKASAPTRGAAPAGRAMVRGGEMPDAAAPPPTRPPRAQRPPSPTTQGGAGDAVLSPETGRPLRQLNDREKAAARSDYRRAGDSLSFRQVLVKKGYRPQDWMK